VLFLEAFVYLKRAGEQRFWLAEAAVRIGMRAMCPAVSGEKFPPTENAGYSAWLSPSFR
jgi:hypothetical protein